MRYERIDIANLHFAFNWATGEIVQFESEEEAQRIINEDASVQPNNCVQLYEEYLQDAMHPVSIAITVELNNICNLQCIYCYQQEKGIRDEITVETIDKIVSYIAKVYASDKFKVLVLRFIGGEPLLSIDKLLYCNREIAHFCDCNGIQLVTHIDTNGTIPFHALLTEISNLDMVICLSPKKDHDYKRSSSFDIVQKNLAALSYEDAKSITIRYNVAHDNICLFEDFLQYLRTTLPQISTVETAWIDDSPCAPEYTNKMSEREFARWNATSAIDLLIKYGYPISHCTLSKLMRCQGTSRYSCKVYSDGAITVCDGMYRNQSRLNIDRLLNQIDALEEEYAGIKRFSPLDDSECALCPTLIQCGGKLFCRDAHEQCNFQTNFDEIAFVETFIRHMLNGNGKYFINM